jgi:murein DD-endopeptidase MepM/ murein hydrolase activator NlpD
LNKIWALAGTFLLVFQISWATDEPYSVTAASLPVVLSSAALQAPPVEEPFLLPVVAKKPAIVSGFGPRTIIGQPKPEAHDGIDYAVPVGTPVRATKSGRVLFAGFSKTYVGRTPDKEPARFLIIRHADGRSSRYVHVANLRVRPGQDVKAGQILGVVAESDEWTQPVMHFEIRNATGQPVAPASLITEVKKL